MNWLAHLLLSEPNVEIRLGNILADIVKGAARQELNSGIQRGIACHQVIDRFTDTHIVVKRSKDRIHSNYRRFAGVLVDIFYDHFLAKNWSQYSHVSLDEFTAEIYESFRAYQGQIPPIVREVVSHVAAEDWLGSYRNVSGVEITLLRISRRLSRRHNKVLSLTPAINELIIHYDALEYDFQEFFPQLFAYVENWCLAEL